MLHTSPTHQPRECWPWVIIMACVALITVPFTVGVSDTWVQIRLGRYILDHGFPGSDPFTSSAAMTGEPYIENAWLTCVVFAALFTLAGPWGLLAWTIAVVSGTYALAIATARRLGASLSLCAVLCPVLAYLTFWRLSVRPHLLTSLGLQVVLWVLVRVSQGSLPPRALWLLPSLQLVWIQCHGGWPLGLALTGLWGLGEAGHWLRRRRLGRGVALPGRVVVLLLVLPVLGLVASLWNPYGLELLRYPFREAALEQALGTNSEWLPPHQVMTPSILFWGFLVWLGLLTGVWLPAGWRRRVGLGVVSLALAVAVCHRPAPPPFAAPLLADRWQQAVLGGGACLLGLWGWHLACTWRSAALTQGLLVLGSVALAWRTVRALPEAVLLTFPLVAAYSPRRWPALGRRGLAAAGLLALVVAVAVLRWPTHVGPGQPPLGVGLNRPQALLCATAFVQRAALRGTVWANASDAAWLLWQLWPQVQVWQDIRLHLYGAEQLQAEDRMLGGGSPDALEAFLRRWPTDYLLLRHQLLGLDRYRRLVHLGWRFVHLDDARAVLAGPQHPEVLTRYGYAHILPWRNQPVTAANAEAVLAEATRALEACPTGARFAWAYKAQALKLLGRHQEAQDARRQVPAQLWIE